MQNSTNNLYGAILAGGIGTRLWPRSRQTLPKQFSDITGSGQTMIQQTAARIADLIPPQNLYVVTGDLYTDLTASQLPQLPAANILAEPAGRNTAPAIGLACVHISHGDPDAIIASLHSDHAIPDAASFQAVLRVMANAAADGHIVTLGIEPTFPHTGLGYVKRAAPLTLSSGETDQTVYHVELFKEKPEQSLAESYVADGRYYWNAGIFVFRARQMLDEIARQQPEVFRGLSQIADSLDKGASPEEINAVTRTVWEDIPNISIDHGVIEQANSMAVVPYQSGWSDVGSWDALDSLLPNDDTQNCVARGELFALDSHGNIVYSNNKVVALINVNDLVVVETDDALLIGNKSEMQRVKEIVEQLRTQDRTELL